MMREDVVTHFPSLPDRRRTEMPIFRSVDEIYRSDAYHSLSIEGYTVTPDLIEKVRQG